MLLPKLKPSLDSRSLSNRTVSAITLELPFGDDCPKSNTQLLIQPIPIYTQTIPIRPLTTVTSIESLLPVFMSHNNTNNGGAISWLAFTRRVPNRMRKLKHTPSTDVPAMTFLCSNKMVTRAQLELSCA